MSFFLFFCAIFLSTLATNGKVILPDNCDCLDWHGACRRQGQTWTDDDTWMYRCAASNAGDATFIGCQLPGTSKFGQIKQIALGQNETIDGFWANCEANEIRQKLELEPRCNVDGSQKHVGDEFRQGIFQWLCLETGRWVTGCFFQNETGEWSQLKIGESGYNGLIRHTCDRYKDNPGIIQYHAEIRDDVPYKNPTNKGSSKNFPNFIDNRLKNSPTEWTHKNVALFIADEPGTNLKVRYLPQSRNIKSPPNLLA